MSSVPRSGAGGADPAFRQTPFVGSPVALGLLGLQHVLVMYAGAVAVPLIIGRALKLPPEQVAMLVSADLFACGLASLIQSWGLPGIGIRMPVMMGVTFAAVTPMPAMGADPTIGLTGIYGAVIASGLFALLAAPLVAPIFFKQMPHALHPLLESGILLAAISAVVLNLFFNGLGSAAAAAQAGTAEAH